MLKDRATRCQEFMCVHDISLATFDVSEKTSQKATCKQTGVIGLVGAPTSQKVLRISCTPLSWKILASHWFAAGLLEEAAAHPQRLTAQGKGCSGDKEWPHVRRQTAPSPLRKVRLQAASRQSKYRVECRTAHTSSASVADGRRQGLRGFLLPVEQPGDSPCSISHQSCGVLSVSSFGFGAIYGFLGFRQWKLH